MAKVKNQNIYSDNAGTLNRLAGEYESIGFDVDRKPGHIIVLALPRTSVRKRRLEAKAAAKRQYDEDED
jgi:hypothetical protein